MSPFLRKAQHNGCQVVVIDPRRTSTAKTADWHIAPLPGTDGFLAMGIGHLLVSWGQQHDDWLDAHTVGWPQFHIHCLFDFIDSVAANDLRSPSFEDGLAAQKLVAACQRSAESKSWQTLN